MVLKDLRFIIPMIFVLKTQITLVTNGAKRLTLYPPDDFCPENVICLLGLLHIFKCTPDYYYYHGGKHYAT